ncbi:3'-5' exoribonuclease YhaM family protein [Coprothermobacter platensis]|uniref:3'-5' exoribonuclease YhaM family protein n=1 Tax=Coprothermobacter platensis TaxID=108819 RepID=UPI000362079C|nr:HD domain-containing protein [Coprothermobacter platensis]
MHYTKRIFSTELQPGMTSIRDLFVLQQKSYGSKKKDGSHFVNVVLSDMKGTVKGFMELNDGQMISVENGQVVCCSGNVGEFNSDVTIYLSGIEKVDLSEIDESTMALLYPSVSNPEELKEELRSLVDSVQSAEMKLLLEYVLLEKIWTEFIKKPAAKSIHHARVGGLLEHSVHVAQIVDKLSSFYPEVNRDLAVTGALLHDIGKVEEMSIPGGDYTDNGKLLGHVVHGTLMLSQFADELGIDEGLKQALLHIVLSHHGEKEWGSPVKPKTLEALLVSMADRTDAYLDHAQEIYRDTKAKGLKWSRYSEPLDVSIFVLDEDLD